MKLTFSKLKTYLFLYFIIFLSKIDYLGLRMESCTNSYYFV